MIYQVITDRYARIDSIAGCYSLLRKEGECTYGTYCGGTFDGLAAKLDYISGMGFDAIWISPVVANVDCGYTGYWAKDLYTINPEFGGADSLRALVAAAHARNMFVMVDMVFNHMGHTAVDAGCRRGDYDYPGAFDAYAPFNNLSDYHQFNDSVDWSNYSNVEDWWLFCLPDVDTENPRAVRVYLDWLNQLIEDFSIDGVRIDTIPYVPKKFWRTISANISAHTFNIGEVNTGDCWAGFCPNVSWYSSYQADDGPVLDAILNYPASEVMRPTFGMDCRTSSGKIVDFGPMTELRDRLQEIRGNFSDIGVLGNFVDSHDTARFLMNRNDPILLQNNLALMFGMEGIPIVYYGTEELMNTGAVDPRATLGYYDPPNLNRWPLWSWHPPDGAIQFRAWLGRLIAFRKKFIRNSQKMTDHFVRNRTYAFLRGDTLFVTFNVGANISALVVDESLPLPVGWDPRSSVCNALTEVKECLSLAKFQERFQSTSVGGWWTKDGSPQVWVPEKKLGAFLI